MTLSAKFHSPLAVEAFSFPVCVRMLLWYFLTQKWCLGYCCVSNTKGGRVKTGSWMDAAKLQDPLVYEIKQKSGYRTNN